MYCEKIESEESTDQREQTQDSPLIAKWTAVECSAAGERP